MSMKGFEPCCFLFLFQREKKRRSFTSGLGWEATREVTRFNLYENHEHERVWALLFSFSFSKRKEEKVFHFRLGLGGNSRGYGVLNFTSHNLFPQAHIQISTGQLNMISRSQCHRPTSKVSLRGVIKTGHTLMVGEEMSLWIPNFDYSFSHGLWKYTLTEWIDHHWEEMVGCRIRFIIFM